MKSHCVITTRPGSRKRQEYRITLKRTWPESDFAGYLLLFVGNHAHKGLEPERTVRFTATAMQIGTWAC